MSSPSARGTNTAYTVGTALTTLPGRPRLRSRLVQNLDETNNVWVGVDPTLTVDSAVCLGPATATQPGDSVEYIDYFGPVYLRADGDSDVRVQEIGGL